MFTGLVIIGVLTSFLIFSIYGISFWITRSLSDRLDIPFVPTPSSSLPLIADRLAIHTNDVVYDIGCGDGRVLFYCAKKHPQARFIGIELNPLLVMWMQIRKFVTRARNVEIRREDMFSADISDATKIYVFLLQDITDTFFKDRPLSPVRIVSRAFQIHSRKPREVFRITPHDIWYGGHLAYVYE